MRVEKEVYPTVKWELKKFRETFCFPFLFNIKYLKNLCESVIIQMNLSFYNIDINYCEFLRKYDKNVPFTTDNKENRPFIGIILKINDITYYAPLTSPKEKHLTMNNQIDFIKIDNGKLGAINLNNMIPVNKENIKKINFNLITNSQYKELLIDQLNWCNKPKNKDTIINRSSRLYKFLYTNNSNKLKNRLL